MKKLFLMLFMPFILSGCMNANDLHPMFEPSNYQMDNKYSTFAEYLKKTEQMIRQTRYFQTTDLELEVQANMPFELLSQKKLQTTKGIILVHGLGDSPFSFVDVAPKLAKQGFLVRTILLEGHGTRPGDMITANYKNWQQLLSSHVEILKGEVDEVYLGGFSTGGNLVYLHAMNDSEIKGLILFAPGFKTDKPNAKYASLAAIVKDWLYDVTPESESVYTRYMNTAINGFGEYYKTSADSMELLKSKAFDRPTFMVLTEHDSVLDVELIKELFLTQFTNPANKLVWYGSSKPQELPSIRTINSHIPELRINSMSHMGILFSPDNPYYGINGAGRICRNGQKTDWAYEYCMKGGEVWYGAYGTQEEGKVVARLTFNPQFNIMMDDLFKVFFNN